MDQSQYMKRSVEEGPGTFCWLSTNGTLNCIVTLKCCLWITTQMLKHSGACRWCHWEYCDDGLSGCDLVPFTMWHKRITSSWPLLVTLEMVTTASLLWRNGVMTQVCHVKVTQTVHLSNCSHTHAKNLFCGAMRQMDDVEMVHFIWGELLYSNYDDSLAKLSNSTEPRVWGRHWSQHTWPFRVMKSRNASGDSEFRRRLVPCSLLSL